MKCRHARNIIAEHLAGEDQDLPEDLQAHLDECSRCAGLWRDQRRIHSALRDAGAAPAPAAPADLAQRARQRLVEGERVPPAPLRVVLVYGSLAAIVIVAAVAIFANRGRLSGRAAPDIAQVGKQPVPHEDTRPPGGTGSSPPVAPTSADGPRLAKQAVAHGRAGTPRGTGSSLRARTRAAKGPRIDERPAPHERDQVDLLIIVWAAGVVRLEEAPRGTGPEPPEDGAGEDAEWLPRTVALAPRSGDMVARATLVSSPVRGPYPSADPSVAPVQSLMFAALPVRSMDSVAQLTSVQADVELPEAESLPDPAGMDGTIAPEPVMLVDSALSGGVDDEEQREPEIVFCIHDGDDPVLLCGELGMGGRDAV